MTTNAELATMLARVETKLDCLNEWRNKYEKSQERKYISIEDKITSIRRYYNNVAMVSGAVGCAVTLFVKKIF